MAELYPVPAEQILIGASKFPSASQDMIGQKEPKFLRQRE